MALVVISGGARSGKSSAAQRLAETRAASGAQVVYAVFGQAVGDPEFAERVERHRSVRPAAFATVEARDSLSWRDQVPEDALLVVECLGTLVAMVMSEIREGGGTPETGVDPLQLLGGRVDELIAWLVRRGADTIVVTNETGWGVVPAYESGRTFRDVLGRANATLTTASDAAYLAVAGRLIDLTSLPADVPWPSE